MESRTPQPYLPGTPVIASDGEIGTVDEVVLDPATGEPSLLAVHLHEGDGRVEVPFALVDMGTSDASQVRLATDRATLLSGAGITLDAAAVTAATATATTGTLAAEGDRLVIPTHEEVLVPTTQEVEVGTVRFHKRVETVPYEALVDVTRDDVSVERVEVGRPITAVPAPRHEGNTLVIPLVEEEIIIEKRLVLREEIRVTRRQVTEQVPITDALRREVIEVEDPTGVTYRAGTPASTSLAAPPATATGDAATGLATDAGDLPPT